MKQTFEKLLDAEPFKDGIQREMCPLCGIPLAPPECVLRQLGLTFRL